MTETFAEKLKEHTKYCNELADQAQKLMTQVKENENIQKREQLLSKAEKIIKVASVASRKFDLEHKSELAALILYVDARRK